MVLVTKELEKFKDYAGFCRVGSFSTNLAEGGVEVRIMAGKFAYKGVFPKDETTEEASADLKAVLDWCKLRGFIEIEESIPDEMFFR